MTKEEKNQAEAFFLEISEEATGSFTRYMNVLYWWDFDGRCYIWSKSKGYWIEGDDGWYDRPVVNYHLTVDEAKADFPGSVPIRFLTDKKKVAKRDKLRRQQIAANTDSQIFEEPSGMPRGFGFSDKGTVRTYQHKQNPSQHPIGKVMFDTGPKYVGFVWLAGVDPANRLFKDSNRMDSKNEAQKWVMEALRKLENAQRAAAKNLVKNNEGES
jgi:hypothetical protein